MQLGGPDAGMASELADTGRYIIHLLDTESGKVEKAQTALHAREVYGVASAETVADYSHLPYTENLINLIVAGADTATAEEIFRVLVPEGALVVTHPGSLNQKNLEKAGFEFVREVPSPVDESQQWIIARKPWPESMGHWTHSRHDANGNAVSPDTAVGEPKRIRWIAGHSGTEVEGMVSDGGRNFYGHSLTRDSFNGMRLWHRDLTQTEEKMDPSTFTMKRLSGNLARPVATENYLFAVAFPTKNLVALDSKTGEIVRSFPEIAMPKNWFSIKESSSLPARQASTDSVRKPEPSFGNRRRHLPAQSSPAVTASATFKGSLAEGKNLKRSRWISIRVRFCGKTPSTHGSTK